MSSSSAPSGGATPSSTPAVTFSPAQLNQLLQTINNNSQSSPKVSDPEPYDGNRDKVKNFIFQCNLKITSQRTKFRDDQQKINWAISWLRGRALSWVEPKIQQNADHFPNWEAFTKALQATFGDPDPQQTAISKLRELRQKGPATTYWSDFQTLSIETKWDNEALISQFLYGLKTELQERYALREADDFTTIDELATWAIKQDNKLFAFRRNKQTPPSIPRTHGKTQPWVPKEQQRTDNPNWHGPAPMILDSTKSFKPKFTKLTDAERQRRMTNKLCLYCGNAGHIARNCTAKTNSKPGIREIVEVQDQEETSEQQWEEVKDTGRE